MKWYVPLLFHSLLLMIIISSSNPIFAIVAFIGVIFLFAALLLYFACDIFAFFLLLVYIGAIVILFLFMIMMLNIKILVLETSFRNSLFFFFFIFQVLLFFFLRPFTEFLLIDDTLFTWTLENNTLKILGFLLFDYFSFFLLFIILLLLVALLAPLYLTLQDLEKKPFKLYRQESYIQIERLAEKNIRLYRV